MVALVVARRQTSPFEGRPHPVVKVGAKRLPLVREGSLQAIEVNSSLSTQSSNRSLCSPSVEGTEDPFCEEIHSVKCSSSVTPVSDRHSLGWESSVQYVGERCNLQGDSLPGPVSKSPLSCNKERWDPASCNTLEKSEQLCNVSALQDGGHPIYWRSLFNLEISW